MGLLAPKNKPQTRLNLKRVIIVGAVAGASIATVLIVTVGTGGSIISSNSSLAAPPPPPPPPVNLLSSAPTGPGGVGTTDGTSDLKIWYRTDHGMSVSNGEITGWENAAGVPEHDLVHTAGTSRPAVVQNALNGYSEVSFTSNSHYLKTAIGTLTDSNFVIDEASTFVVNQADQTNQASCLYTTDPLVGNSRFTNHIPWGGRVYYDIGTCCSQNARIQINNVTGVTNYNIWTYDAKPSTGKQLYQNGTMLQTSPNTSTYHSHSTQRFRIGRNYKGDVTEVIIFRKKINTTQRYIVDNYLSTKYNIPLDAHDLYAHDNGSGIYDHDMAGIGRINSSDEHTDSQGTGIVRIHNAQDMDDNEFLFWAHENSASDITSTQDIPAGVNYRMERIWKVSEVDISGNAVDVGDIDMVFDLAGLGVVNASEVRLLIDTDMDGSFADETGIDGAINPGNDLYSFEGISGLENNMTFTIGIGQGGSLPIELGTFDANLINDDHVLVEWMTVSERDNDYFSVEKSTDGQNFEVIGTVKGAGNSNQKLFYSYEDYDLFNGTAYYRLRQTDHNGDTEVFDPVSVKYNATGKGLEITSVGPNPFVNDFKVNYRSAQRGVIDFAVYDLNGRLRHQQEFTIEEGANTINFSQGYELNAGTYLVVISDESGNKDSKKVVKR